MGPIDPPYLAGLPTDSDLRVEADKRASTQSHRIRHSNERRRELPSTSTSFPLSSHPLPLTPSLIQFWCPSSRFPLRPLSHFLSPITSRLPTPTDNQNPPWPSKLKTQKTSPALRPPQVPPTRRPRQRPARCWRPSRGRTTRTRPRSCRRAAANISNSSSSTARRSPPGPRPTRGARRGSARSPARWSFARGARIGTPIPRPSPLFATRRGWSLLG